MSAGELLKSEGFRLAEIKKQFGDAEVLRGLNLSAGRGEFITLLGPSGCGKTTTLRIIAGLETADAGRVFIDGKDVTALDPDKRGVNMVFQNYALFPHMNVEQNIGYSLKLKGIPKNEIKDSVAQALSLVRLSGFEKRKPNELSGGEKQRVAVARAVINRPKVLLLDEPLGALDLQLRRQMQIELKRLQKQLGITFIYITHDQEEALTMSDRIAVMRNGLFDQIGSAAEIYNKPKTAFTARFVGGANVFRGRINSAEDITPAAHDDQGAQGSGKVRIGFLHPAGMAFAEFSKSDVGETCENLRPGAEILIAVREEYIAFLPQDSGVGLAATIIGKSFSGGLSRISAKLDCAADTESGMEIKSSCHGIDSPLETGDKVIVSWNASSAVLLESQ